MQVLGASWTKESLRTCRSERGRWSPAYHACHPKAKETPILAQTPTGRRPAAFIEMPISCGPITTNETYSALLLWLCLILYDPCAAEQMPNGERTDFYASSFLLSVIMHSVSVKGKVPAPVLYRKPQTFECSAFENRTRS